MEVIGRNIAKLFVLTAADKASLRDGLEANGVSVCLCETEADVCIARGQGHDLASPDNGCHRVAFSVDSNLLVYDSISAVLRPLPRHSGYALYLKPDVLHALDLPSSRHLVLYGIVSENDYSRNVEQLGLAKNADLIRSLPFDELTEIMTAYIEAASRATGELVDPRRFDIAHRVFGTHQQRLLEGPGPTNELYRNYRRRFDELKDLRLANKSGPSARPSFYVARGSVRNQFRPIFASEDSILAVKQYKDINSTTRDQELPRLAPAQQTRPASAKKKPKKKRKREGRAKTKPKTGAKRTVKDATRSDRDLRRKYPTKTLCIGSVAGCLRKQQLGDDVEMMHQQLRAAVDTTAAPLSSATSSSSSVTSTTSLDSVSLATEGLFPSAPAPSDAPVASWVPSSSAERRRLLDEIIDSPGFIYAGAIKETQESEFSTPQKPTEAVDLAYFLFRRTTKMPPLYTFKSRTAPDASTQAMGFKDMSAMSMVSVQASLRSHFRNAEFGEKNEDEEKSDIEFFFEMNKVTSTYADFPKAALKQGFVCLSESALIDILWANPATKNITIRILKVLGQEDGVRKEKRGAKKEDLADDDEAEVEDFSTKKAATEYVLHHKARFINALFGHGQYRQASLQQDQVATHYKIKGTICEDDAEDISEQDDAVDTVQQLTIQAPFLEDDDEDLDQAPSTAHLHHEAAAPCAAPVSPPSTSTGQMNWKQRSKLLQNLETVYQRPEDCPPANDTIVLGADPGEINALVVAKLDPRQGQQRHVVKITRKFLSAPYVKFRRLLEAKKETTGIQDLEAGTPNSRGQPLISISPT
ncbi:hypothetical protein BGZ68_004853 [Mortierella alpina]|nr:hypothetical protein BGZ68_004853 [Mortierella alpina]